MDDESCSYHSKWYNTRSEWKTDKKFCKVIIGQVVKVIRGGRRRRWCFFGIKGDLAEG